MTATSAAVSKVVWGSGVLCVIDFNEGSRAALQAAISIAECSSARVTALYTYRLDQPRNMVDVSQWKKNLDLDANDNFNKMSSTLINESKVTCEFKAEVGFVNDRVDAFVRSNSVGMIVISKQLVEANGEHFFHMLDRIGCPLLVVPSN